MSRSQIRRIAVALTLVAALTAVTPGRAEAAADSPVSVAGIVNLWNQLWEWAFGPQKGPQNTLPDLPTQANGSRFGVDTDNDKGSGIDPNGGNGNGNSNGNGNGNSQ